MRTTLLCSRRGRIGALAAAIMWALAAASASATSCPGASSCPYSGVSEIGVPGSTFMRTANGVAVDSSGNVFVASGHPGVFEYVAAGGTRLIGGRLPIGGSSPLAEEQFQTNGPTAVAVDSSGNLYESDEQANRVVEFGPTGLVRARWGSSGSGAGQLSGPGGLAVDASGDIYVADQLNNRVVEFAPTSGTPVATFTTGYNNVSLSNPTSVALGNGHLYVTCGCGGPGTLVQVLNPTTGSPSHPLGSTPGFPAQPGQFFDAVGVATDAAGDVFVDTGTDVQRYDGTNWTVLPTGDGTGVAVHGSTLYRAQGSGSRVEKFDSTSGADQGSIGAPALGELLAPRGGSVDSSGNLYVASTRDDSVVKYDSTGAPVARFDGTAGGGSAFKQPQGTAVDAGGNVWVADTYNSRVVKIDPSTGAMLATVSTPGQPQAIAGDSHAIYVAVSQEVIALPATATSTADALWTAQVTDGSQPYIYGIASDDSSDVYLANGYYNSGWTYKVDKLHRSDGTPDGSGWSVPTVQGEVLRGVAFANGEVFTTNTYPTHIDEWDASGTKLATFGGEDDNETLCAGTLAFPEGLAGHGTDLYAFDSTDEVVSKFSFSGGNGVPACDTHTPSVSITTPTSGSTPTFSGHAGTQASDDPTIHVIVYPSNAGANFGATAASLTTQAAGDGSWSVSPSSALPDGSYTAVATQRGGPLGIVAVTAPVSFTVGQANPCPGSAGAAQTPNSAGMFSWHDNIQGFSANTAGGFCGPEGVRTYWTSGSDHHLIVADTANSKVESLTSAGTTAQTYGASGGLTNPRAAVVAGGYTWVSDSFDGLIKRYDYSTGAYHDTLSSTLGLPRGIATDDAGDLVAVADAGSGKNLVDLFAASDGHLVRTITGPSGDALNSPEGVAFDHSGNVLVADTQNSRVVVFDQQGNRLTSWGSGHLNHPTDLSVDNFGNVWVADWADNRVVWFDSGGSQLGVLTEAAFGQALAGPVSVSVDPGNGDLYVADTGDNQIVHYTIPAPGAQTDAASNVTATGATLHGTVSTNDGPWTCQFNVRPYPATGLPDPTQYEQTTGEQCHGGNYSPSIGVYLAPLPSGYHYQDQLVAQRPDGSNPAHGQWTDIPVAQAPVAQTDGVVTRQDTDLTVKGTINPEGFDTHYYVRYGPDLNSLSQSYPTQPADLGFSDSSPHDVTVDLPGLTPASQVCFRFVAANSTAPTSFDGGAGICDHTAGGAGTPIVHTDLPQQNPPGATLTLTGGIDPEGNGGMTWFYQYGDSDVNMPNQVPFNDPGAQLSYSDFSDHGVTTDIPIAAGQTIFYRLVGVTADGTHYYGAGDQAKSVTRPAASSGGGSGGSGGGSGGGGSQPAAPGCTTDLTFGPIHAKATCLHREGLTWTTSGEVQFAGIKLVPNDASARVIIDPLNLRIAATGQVKVQIGPATVLGHTFGPYTIYTGSFNWVFQGQVDPAITNQLYQLLGGIGVPSFSTPSFPGAIVNLPDLSAIPKIPKLPNLPIPDFSKISDPAQLAKLANLKTTQIQIPGLNGATVSFPDGLIPNVSIPQTCISTDQAPFLAALPLTGQACITISDDVATVDANVDMGQLLDDTSGQIELTLFPDGTINIDKATAQVGEIDLGPITLDQTNVNYDGSKDAWHADGGAELWFLGDASLTGSLDVVNGGIVNGSILLDGGQFGIPIGPVTLNKLAISYHTTPPPTQLGGGIGFGFGPEDPNTGDPVLEATGNATATFGSSPGLNVQATLNAAGTKLADGKFNWDGGTGRTSAQINVGYTTPVVDLGWPIGKHQAHIGGSLTGFYQAGQFQVDGKASLTLDSTTLAGVVATVSNKGFAACGQANAWLFSGNAGVGYLFANHSFHGWLGAGSCGLSDYQIQATASSAQAGPKPRTIRIPAGQKEFTLAFQGEGGAPEITLSRPGGRTITTSASNPMDIERDHIVNVDPANDTTTIILASPAGGKWTATPQPGSVAIKQIAAAHELPEPRIQASVRPAGGGRYALAYRLHRLAGQQVSFREQSGSVTHVLGTTTKGGGRIAFVPAYGPGGIRRIVATVVQDGLVREQDVVAKFAVPTRMGPPAPARLRIARSGNRATISWRPVAGATKYLVLTQLNGAVRRSIAVTGAKPVKLTGVFANLPVSASVAALGPTGRPGAFAKAKVAGRMPKPPKRKRKR